MLLGSVNIITLLWSSTTSPHDDGTFSQALKTIYTFVCITSFQDLLKFYWLSNCNFNFFFITEHMNVAVAVLMYDLWKILELIRFWGSRDGVREQHRVNKLLHQNLWDVMI